MIVTDRLDELLKLRGRVDAEISAERDRIVHREAQRERERRQRLDDLDPRRVRAWARRNNLPCGDRGRVSTELKEQYLAAQQGVYA